MMKKIFLILNAVCLVVMFDACGGKRPEQISAQDLPAFTFTNADTTSIQQLAEHYVDLVCEGNFEAAADMLYVVRNDSILPLSEEQRTGYLTTMRVMPFYGCTLKELNLFSDRDNELRIAMQITEDGNSETGEGCTYFFLNPVEKDGTWYLTLLDKYAEGVGLYH